MEDRVKRDATLDITGSVSVFGAVFVEKWLGPAGDSFLVLFLAAAASLVVLSLELDRVLGL